ncbi:MAG: ketoacyl-ACP synthase III [Vicingaceae bacterium]|nr:ketoacyl-ACP synthase III [Vicingaceae bacterium]
MKAFIKHITEYYPQQKISNNDFFKKFPKLKVKEDTLLKVGVSNRHIVNEDITASDLSFFAANKLFEETNFDRNDIDTLVFCSTEFDHYTPTTSAILQHRLNLSTNIAAIDIVSSCTGFIHSLSLAKGMVEANDNKNVLLLCVSTLTKTFHEKDANSHFLFGDAATAILISNRKENGIGKIVLGTDGSKNDYIIVKDGGARNKLTDKSYNMVTNEYGNTTCNANFYMNGTGVFLFGLKTVPKLITDILIKNNTTFEEIDFFVFHQANEFLLKTLQKKLGIPNEKFVIHMEETGNTVAATIPIALNSLMKKKKLIKGNKILIAAFGTGLTWGGTIINY